MENESDVLLKYKLLYFTGSFLLIIGVTAVFIQYIDLSSWLEVVISVPIIMVSSYFLGKHSNDIFDIILSEEQKEKTGFYKVQWKSKEFDKFVGEDLVELYQDTNTLFEFFSVDGHSKELVREPSIFSDHSFMVLSIAKAYEGILKKILIQKEVVTEEDLALNPSLNVGAYFNPSNNERIFNLLKDRSRDKAIPHVIYSTYQECRNQILHHDQFKDRRIKTFSEAEFYRRRILDAIYKAYSTFCE